jgi:hypothetical protein
MTCHPSPSRRENGDTGNHPGRVHRADGPSEVNRRKTDAREGPQMEYGWGCGAQPSQGFILRIIQGGDSLVNRFANGSAEEPAVARIVATGIARLEPADDSGLESAFPSIGLTRIPNKASERSYRCHALALAVELSKGGLVRVAD